MKEGLNSSWPQTATKVTASICSFFKTQVLAQIDEQSVELTYRTEVPDQRVDQTKNLLFFSYELSENRQGRPILARFTPSQALRELLEGSCLSSILAHQHVISVSQIGYPN